MGTLRMVYETVSLHMKRSHFASRLVFGRSDARVREGVILTSFRIVEDSCEPSQSIVHDLISVSHTGVHS